ncbi:MAG: hypothetical protein P8Y64_11580 [Gammaproteobacteria bacterium]
MPYNMTLKIAPLARWDASPRCVLRPLALRWTSMKLILIALMLFIAHVVFAADGYLIVASPKVCKQGLYHQPSGGPFSVFLFCDDALGSNIGIINTADGAGPGTIPLPQPKTWDKWDVNDRFWQQPEWATDVNSFAWSPDLRFLYVATSGIYGTGDLYKLDLVKRTYVTLLPDSRTPVELNHGFTTEITHVDIKTGELTVEFETFRKSAGKTVVSTVRVK